MRPEDAGPPTLGEVADGLAADGGHWERRMVAEVREHAIALGLATAKADHWSGNLSAIGMIVGMFVGDLLGGTIVALAVPDAEHRLQGWAASSRWGSASSSGRRPSWSRSSSSADGSLRRS